ncbi:MAG TPA: choice-of-anchor Q domain-containing protein [Polyangia bacterium]
MRRYLPRFLAIAHALTHVAGLTTGCNVHVNVLEASSGSPCDVVASPADTSRPSALVGDGTPGSCTEDAFNAALEVGGIIRFRCGAYPFTLTISAEKVISRDTVIDGGNTVTLDGAGKSRLFVLGAPGGAPISLTLQYLTLMRGYATVTPATAGAPSRAGGSAILQFGGSLVITDSVLRDNDASAVGPDEAGGAVCSLGGRLLIARSVLDGNRAGSGGAVAAIGTELTLLRSQLTNNQAVGQGLGAQGIGGALVVDEKGQSVGMCQVTLSGNQASNFGTGMHLQGIMGEAMSIEQASILDNLAPDSSQSRGGPAVFLGIITARLSSVTVAGNQGKVNPGIWVNGGDQPSQAATIHFTNVTIAQNHVYRHADPTSDGVGAALWIEGVVRGEIVNCTLADNLGEFGSGIVHPEQLVVRNTIISNQGTNAWNAQNCSELGAPTLPARGDHVLQWPEESLDSYLCVAGATIADPVLGPLQDNGGFAPTMMPSATSPAVAAGTDCPGTDARRHVRPSRCTLGAVEADGTAGGCSSCGLFDAALPDAR